MSWVDPRLIGDLCHALDDIVRVYGKAAPNVAKRATEMLAEHGGLRRTLARRTPPVYGLAVSAIDEGFALVGQMNRLEESARRAVTPNTYGDDLLLLSKLSRDIRRLAGIMRAASYSLRLRWLHTQVPKLYLTETVQKAARTESGHIEHVCGILSLHEAEVPAWYVRSTGLDINTDTASLIISGYSNSVAGEYVAALSVAGALS